MDGICRHNLPTSGFRSGVLMCPAEEACCYVMLADGVESDSHKRPWMHEAQLSRTELRHSSRWPSHPLFLTAATISSQGMNSASAQLQR